MNDTSISRVNEHISRRAPDRFVAMVAGVLLLLVLSESVRFRGFHSVDGILFATALMLFAALALLLVFVIALLRRKPAHVSLSSLLVFVTCVAVTCAWFRTKVERANRQRQILEQLDSRANQLECESPWNVARTCPTIETALEEWLGTDFLSYPIKLGFNREVDEETCAIIAQMPTLEALFFHRGEINDASLAHLEGLRNLKRLKLPNRGPSEKAIRKFKRALPHCEISEISRRRY